MQLTAAAPPVILRNASTCGQMPAAVFCFSTAVCVVLLYRYTFLNFVLLFSSSFLLYLSHLPLGKLKYEEPL